MHSSFGKNSSAHILVNVLSFYTLEEWYSALTVIATIVMVIAVETVLGGGGSDDANKNDLL